MTVSFGHPAHLATVWLPQLTPTAGKVVSTIIALLTMALIVTAVAALFAVFCLEKNFHWGRAALTFALALVITLVAGGGLQHVTGTNTVHGSTPTDSRAEALAAARSAAAPASSWTEKAREVPAAGRTLQQGWLHQDLQKISAAVAQSRHMKLGYAGAPAALDTTHESPANIAAHGTSYLQGSQKLRCVVSLKDVVKNNVGEPVSAQINDVRCAPASS